MSNTVITHNDFSGMITPDFFEPSFYEEHQAVSVGGRNAAFYVEHPLFSGVLRKYKRGGLLGKFVHYCYVWLGQNKTRSWDEFSTLLYLYQQGFAVPKPIAAFYRRHGLCYRAAIITERLPQAKTLIEVLQALSADVCCGQANHTLLAEVLERVAKAIVSMHRLGVYHADLNAFNILLTPDNNVYIIDFDKSKRMAISRQDAEKNLARLQRHLQKILGDQGVVFMAEIKKKYRKLA